MSIKQVINRRKFFSLLSVSTTSAFLSFNLYGDILTVLSNPTVCENFPNQKRLPFTLNELILKEPKDTLEENTCYFTSWSESLEYMQVMQYIQDTINKNKIKIPKGNIVVLGEYRSKIVDMLRKKYKYKNSCIGIEIFKYTNYPKLVINDLKLLKAGDLGPISFGWNSVLLDWEKNPRLKLAGFNFLKQSLVPGGFLIDISLKKLPKDLNTKELKLFKASKYGTTWQKIPV